METIQPTDLCLEFTGANAPEGDLRRQVTDICVSRLGLSASDAESLFERGGSFLVSRMKLEVDLASIINNLEALGVLVRPSTDGHHALINSSLHPARRRAALYSSRYGDLLSMRDIQTTLNASPTQPQPKQRLSSTRVALLIIAVLVSVGIPSSRYWSMKSDSKNWTIDDFRPTSWGDTTVNMPTAEESPATFRGSASLADVRILSQVSRNANAYSARFMAHTSNETLSPLRIEGEPVFLSAQGNEYAATTTYTMTDRSGGFRTGSARIQVTLKSDGTPEQAHITLDLPTEPSRLSSSTDKTVTFSVGLSPG